MQGWKAIAFPHIMVIIGQSVSKIMYFLACLAENNKIYVQTLVANAAKDWIMAAVTAWVLS